MWWLAATVSAVEPAEEIIVWGDPFARWERRWFVQTEVHYLDPQIVHATTNHELSLAGLQIRAVLDCDIDFVLGPQAREVSCAIEDIGLVARPRFNVDTNDAVLAEVDETLTGKVVQLQVKAGGEVPNVDLEGIETHNDRERKRAEQLRQLMSRVILPFHIDMTETPRDGAQWYEYNSELFRLPAATVFGLTTRQTFSSACTTGSVGGSTLAHYMNGIDPEHLIVQSVGRATLTCPPRSGILSIRSDGLASETGAAADLVAMDMSGVSIVDRDSGILSERVWVVAGELTASSQKSFYDLKYKYAGRLRMLGQEEQVDVGPSWVSRSVRCESESRVPCVGTDTRPEWQPLDP